jgi:hypothetical protein
MTGMKRLLFATVLALAGLALVPLAAGAQFGPAPGRKPLIPRFGGSKTEAPLPPVYFPALSGKNLAGESFTFPDQMAGQISVVFLVWSPEQEIFLETWMPAMHNLLQKYEKLHLYVLYLLPKSAQASAARTGWPWTPSSRPALTPEEQQKVLIPVYADREAVLRALKIEPDEFLHVVLVNPDKQVEWDDRGARNSGRGDELDMQIARVASGSKER